MPVRAPVTKKAAEPIPARHLEMFLQASGNFATNSG